MHVGCTCTIFDRVSEDIEILAFQWKALDTETLFWSFHYLVIFWISTSLWPWALRHNLCLFCWVEFSLWYSREEVWTNRRCAAFFQAWHQARDHDRGLQCKYNDRYQPWVKNSSPVATVHRIFNGPYWDASFRLQMKLVHYWSLRERLTFCKLASISVIDCIVLQFELATLDIFPQTYQDGISTICKYNAIYSTDQVSCI